MGKEVDEFRKRIDIPINPERLRVYMSEEEIEKQMISNHSEFKIILKINFRSAILSIHPQILSVKIIHNI